MIPQQPAIDSPSSLRHVYASARKLFPVLDQLLSLKQVFASAVTNDNSPGGSRFGDYILVEDSNDEDINLPARLVPALASLASSDESSSINTGSATPSPLFLTSPDSTISSGTSPVLSARSGTPIGGDTASYGNYTTAQNMPMAFCRRPLEPLLLSLWQSELEANGGRYASASTDAAPACHSEVNDTFIETHTTIPSDWSTLQTGTQEDMRRRATGHADERHHTPAFVSERTMPESPIGLASPNEHHPSTAWPRQDVHVPDMNVSSLPTRAMPLSAQTFLHSQVAGGEFRNNGHVYEPRPFVSSLQNHEDGQQRAADPSHDSLDSNMQHPDASWSQLSPGRHTYAIAQPAHAGRVSTFFGNSHVSSLSGGTFMNNVNYHINAQPPAPPLEGLGALDRQSRRTQYPDIRQPRRRTILSSLYLFALLDALEL